MYIVTMYGSVGDEGGGGNGGGGCGGSTQNFPREKRREKERSTDKSVRISLPYLCKSSSLNPTNGNNRQKSLSSIYRGRSANTLAGGEPGAEHG